MIPIHHPPAHAAPGLHLRQEGEGAPVLCLHSSGATGNQWRSFFDTMQPAGLFQRFSEPVRLLAPDFHGHGRSGAWPSGETSHLRVDGEAAARLLPAWPRGVHLVGHSYGGAVALWLAMRYPERVRSLALYEPVAFNLLRETEHDAGRAEATAIGQLIVAMVRAGRLHAAARVFTEYWSGGDGWSAMSATQQNAVVERMDAVRRHFEALDVTDWDTEALARMRVPVLLLEGEHTRAPTRRIVDVLAGLWPQARRHRVGGAGHLGPITHAGAVARLIAGHVHEAVQVSRAEMARHWPASTREVMA